MENLRMPIETNERNRPSTSGLQVRRTVAAVATLFYFLFVGALTSYAFLFPYNLWDMLAYTAVIESWHTSNAIAIHEEAYSSIRNLPEYAALVGIEPRKDSDYNRDAASDSYHFVQALPFYSIKPLYCLAAYTWHRLGFSYRRSLNLVSIFSFVLVAVLTWFWSRRYLDEWWCAVFAALLVVSPPIYACSRFVTPDALYLAFIAIALYLLLETPRAAAGSLFLLLTIWVRPDALIVAGLFLCTFLFLKRIDFVEWGGFCLLALLSYGAIRIFGGPYSWVVLFHNSFIGPLTQPGNAIVGVTPRMYFFTIALNGWTLVKTTSLAVVFLMGMLAIALHRRRPYRYMTGIVLASEILHFLLFPSIENRFYVVSAFFVPLSLVMACSPFFPEQSARLHIDSALEPKIEC
jgi:hypothetical protein